MSSQGGAGGAGNFPINIQANAGGLDAIIKSIAQYEAQLIRAALASTNFANAAARVGPALSASASGGTQFASSMSGANKTLDQFTGSSNQASASGKTFQSTIVSLGQGTGQFGTAANQANTSARGFQSTIVSLGQGTGQFANATNQANSSARGFQSTVVSLGQGTGTLNTNMGQANTSANAFKQTTIGLGQATGTLKTNLNETSAGFTNMGDQAETAANKTSSSIQNAGAAVTSMVGKVSGLFIGFTGLKMAMEEAAGMQEMLKAAQDKVAKATERVNEAIAQYGKGSHQATQATQALEKAQNGLAFAERNTNFAIGDTYYFMALLSTQILSSVVPALIQWKETKEKVVGAINFLKNALTDLPNKIIAKAAATAADTAAETANAGATNLSGMAKVRAVASAIALTVAHGASTVAASANAVVMGLLTGVLSRLGIAHTLSAGAVGVHSAAMGVASAASGVLTAALARLRLMILANMAALGPIAIAIIAVTAAIAALSTDFMGSRTALQNWGRSLGDTIPILKPFLEGIQGIGGALGITGESAEETKTHFDRMSLGFANMSTLWNDTVALLQQSNIALVQDFGFAAAGVSTALETMNTDFENQIDATVSTWNKFVDALSKGNFSGAVDILTESLSAIPGILMRIGQRFTELSQEIQKGLRAIGTDLYKELAKVSTALQGLFGEIGKRIVSWLGDIASDVMAWVNTNVVEPILGFLDSIGIPATEIWTAIVGAANSMNATVTAWVTENIVNPILGFIDSIQGDPQAIWNAIVGGATSIVNIVTSWVTENIVNPILGFIDLVKTDPATIWTSIVGSANALVATVTTWVKTNIVDPILDIPNQIKDIISQVIAKLGFSASVPGEVASWVTSIVLYIGSIPGKIVGKAVEIVKALLSGDWAGEVQKFLDNVWKALTGWIPGMGGGTPGVTSAIPSGGQVTTETPGSTESKTPSSFNTDTFYNEKTGMFEKIPTTGQTAPGTQTLNKPVSLTTPGQTFQTDIMQGPGNANPVTITPQMRLERAANAPSLGAPAVNVAGGVGGGAPGGGTTPNNAYQQQNPDTPALGTSNFDLNKAAEKGKVELDNAAAYKQAEAALNELVNGETAKAGSDEYLQALGAKRLLQTKENILAYGNNSAAVLEYGKQLYAQQQIEEGLDKKNAELRGSIVGTTLALADGTLQGKLAEQGYLEQTAALQKMETDTIKNAQALTTYGEQLESGRIQQAAFTTGEQEQQRALYDKEVALSKNAGKLSEYANQLNQGKILSLAYAEGQQKITQEYLQMIEQTANLNGQFAELSVKVDDVSQRQIVYNNAFAEGRVKALEFVQQIDAAVGAYDGYRSALMSTSEAMQMGVDMTMLGTKAIEDFVAVARRSPEAIKELHGWIIELGNSIKGDLASAAKEGSDELEDAFDDLEEKIGFKLGGNVKTTLEFAANIENALNEVEAGLGTLSMVIQFGADPGQIKDVGKGILDNFEATFEEDGDNVGNGLIDNLDKNFRKGGPQITAIFNELKTNINTIMNSPVGSDAFNTAFQNIKNLMGSLRGDVDNLGQGFNALPGAMSPAITSASQLGQSLKGISDNGTLNVEFTNNWGQAADVFSGKASKAAQATNDWGTFQDAWRGKADQSITSATQLAQNIDAVGTAANNAGTATNNWATFQDVWNGKTAEGVTSANNLAGGIAGTGTAATTATPEVQAFYNTIANFGTIEAVAQVIFETNLPAHAKTGAEKMATEMSVLDSTIAPHFGAVEVTAQTSFETTIPGYATTGVSNVGTEFGKMPGVVAPSFGTIDSLAQTIFVTNIPGHAAEGVSKISASFKKMEQDGKTALNNLKTAADSAFSAMISKAGQVASAIDGIKSSADSAKSSVNSLKSAVESLPNIHREIIYEIKTVGSKPSGGQFGLHATVDKPTLFLAGEGSGPETIDIRPGSGSLIGKNNNVNVDVMTNSQSNVGGSGQIIQTSVNNQVNGVRGQDGTSANGTNTSNTGNIITPGQPGANGANGAAGTGGITVQAGSQTISISENGTVTITQGNQTITTGPNGTSITMGNGIRNSNPNQADIGNTNQQNGSVVSSGSIVGQNNQTNVQSDTNTNSNVGGNGTITQTQTNTQNPPGTNQQTQTNTGTSTNIPTQMPNTQSGQSYSQSSSVISGSGQSIGSGHNISYQRNNSGQTLTIDGQTYQAINDQGTSSPSETEFRRRRQTGSNAGMGTRTVVEQPIEINLYMDKWKAGRVMRKWMYDVDEGLYK